jgi:hypothetical protein
MKINVEIIATKMLFIDNLSLMDQINPRVNINKEMTLMNIFLFNNSLNSGYN